jgi:hypothetical protein
MKQSMVSDVDIKDWKPPSYPPSRTVRDHPMMQLDIGVACRNLMRWPLYHISQWDKLFLINDEDINPNDYLEMGMNNRSNLRHSAEEISNALITNYPASYPILNRFQGEISICGGFVSSLCESTDIDFFFHGVSAERADEIMIESIGLIMATHSNQKCKIKMLRSLNVTTIIFHYTSRNSDISFTKERSYQFIHRLYNSLDHVLGGFDLACSMVACVSPGNFVATEQGAWSLVNNVIVVDKSCRSTTFGGRLEKYQKRGFGLIFPGINQEVFDRLFTKIRVREEEFNEKLNDLQKEYSVEMVWDSQLIYTGFDTDYGDHWYAGDVSRPEFAIKRFPITADLCVVLKHGNMIADTRSDASDYNESKFSKRFLGTEMANDSCFEENGNYESLVSMHHLHIFSDIRKSFYTPCILVSNVDLVNPFLIEMNNRLSKTNWITKNPQRQWSGTLKPLPISIGQFYGNQNNWNGNCTLMSKDCWVAFREGLEQKDCVLHSLSRDVFIIILEYIARSDRLVQSKRIITLQKNLHKTTQLTNNNVDHSIPLTNLAADLQTNSLIEQLFFLRTTNVIPVIKDDE